MAKKKQEEPEKEQIHIKPPTGRLMCKFDDENPTEMGLVHDFGTVTISLKQVAGANADNCIVFHSRSGKQMKLYIEDL